jgi:hypothetical protein
MKFLVNTIVSLKRKLQAFNDGEGNNKKYLLEELYKQKAFFRAKIQRKMGKFYLNRIE